MIQPFDVFRIRSSNKFHITIRYSANVPIVCTRKSECVKYLYSGAERTTRHPKIKSIWVPTRTDEVEQGRILHSGEKVVLMKRPASNQSKNGWHETLAGAARVSRGASLRMRHLSTNRRHGRDAALSTWFPASRTEPLAPRVCLRIECEDAQQRSTPAFGSPAPRSGRNNQDQSAAVLYEERRTSTHLASDEIYEMGICHRETTDDSWKVTVGHYRALRSALMTHASWRRGCRSGGETTAKIRKSRRPLPCRPLIGYGKVYVSVPGAGRTAVPRLGRGHGTASLFHMSPWQRPSVESGSMHPLAVHETSSPIDELRASTGRFVV